VTYKLDYGKSNDFIMMYWSMEEQVLSFKQKRETIAINNKNDGRWGGEDVV